MVARPHIAALIEDAVSTRVERLLRSRGLQERIIGYTGYGTPTQARILARVVLRRTGGDGAEASADVEATEEELAEAQATGRGWRSFLTAPVIGGPVHISLGAASIEATTDRGGNVDITLTGHGLDPGWHHVTITAANGARTRAAVRIIDPQVETGVVSDIDDTVMVTHLPRILIAAWNTFVRTEQAREVVPGMAAFYRSLVSEEPRAPLFYLSTGAWNTAPTLMRFLRRHDYPPGALLLTDWGPTNTGWFRSGRQHKSDELHRLHAEFPAIRWILVGDDGQHDPAIYGEFAQRYPQAVEAIAIRRLSPSQHLLSHALPVATDELLGKTQSVPMVRAPDGFTLHRLVHHARRAARRAREALADA